jgi:hypothetical protein
MTVPASAGRRLLNFAAREIWRQPFLSTQRRLDEIPHGEYDDAPSAHAKSQGAPHHKNARIMFARRHVIGVKGGLN